jgi:hypothetical protein
VKTAAMVRIAKLLDVGLAEVLPWKRLGTISAHAIAAAVPSWLVMRAFALPPLVLLMVGGAAYATTFAAILGVRFVWNGRDSLVPAPELIPEP